MHRPPPIDGVAGSPPNGRRPGPPSSPPAVTIASPRTRTPPTPTATFFNGTPAKRSRNGRRPVDQHPAVRRAQRADADTSGPDEIDPRPVGADPWPTRAAEGEHGQVAGDLDSSPSVAGTECGADRRAVRRSPSRATGGGPRSSPRGRLGGPARRAAVAWRERRGKTRPLEPTKVGSPEPGAPLAQIGRAEDAQRRREPSLAGP